MHGQQQEKVKLFPAEKLPHEIWGNEKMPEKSSTLVSCFGINQRETLEKNSSSKQLWDSRS